MKLCLRHVTLIGLMTVLILLELTPIVTAPENITPGFFGLQEEIKRCSVVVTLDSIQLVHNYFVGKHWSHWGAVNGERQLVFPEDLPTQIFKKTINDFSTELEIKAIAQEKDEYPDIGSNSELVKITCPPEPSQKSRFPLQLSVKVKENNEIFAGFSAVWKFDFLITVTTFIEKKPISLVKKVKVNKIIDNETILVKMDGNTEAVKYAGIDIPQSKKPTDELGECFGEEVFQYNQELVGDKTVWLRFDIGKRDQYGRLLAYVFTSSKVSEPEKTMVNAILIAQGYAQLDSSTPNRQYESLFIDLQQEARKSGKGLWCECKGLNCISDKASVEGISIIKIEQMGGDEIVTIKNEGNKDVDIGGWQLQSLDEKSEDIKTKTKFPEACILPSRGMLRVHSGPESFSKISSTCDQIVIILYPKWEGASEGYVWDDKGGFARLLDQNEKLVANYRY